MAYLGTARLAAEKINSLGIQTVIITLRGKGLLIFNVENHQYIKSFLALPVDTAGLGDAFNRDFCASLAKSESL